MALNKNVDEGLLSDPPSVPCNSPTCAQEDKLKPNCDEWQVLKKRPLNPCCSGGTLKQWIFIVGLYETGFYLVLNVLKIIYFLKYRESETSRQALSPTASLVVYKIEIFCLGIICGIILLIADFKKNKVLCIVHIVLCLLVSLQFLALVGLVSIFRKAESKWSMVAAYACIGTMQIYFAVCSYGFHGVIKRDLVKANLIKKRKETIQIVHLNTEKKQNKVEPTVAVDASRKVT